MKAKLSTICILALTASMHSFAAGDPARGGDITAPPEDCNYPEIIGDEFIFAKTFPGGEHYGYQSWKGVKRYRGVDLEEPIPYEGYVGRSGKLLPEKIYRHGLVDTTYKRKAVLDNCKVVYTTVYESSQLYDGIYFKKDVERAQALIGKSLWYNATQSPSPHTLVTPNREVAYPVLNLEEVIVTAVVLETFAHARGSHGFFVRVKTKSGQEGLLGFDERYFFEYDPIPKGTASDVISAIRQQKVKVGMTAIEAKLSWGDPEKVNKSVGSWGVHEQWVYGDQYLYFKNGRLDSYQTSN